MHATAAAPSAEQRVGNLAATARAITLPALHVLVLHVAIELAHLWM